MLKKASKNLMLDKLHLYSVRTLMGITVAGLSFMGLQVYSYFTVVRPQREQEWNKQRMEEMELEQQEREAERLRRENSKELIS